MADVELPQLGETVTEGTITQWFKEVGDRVDIDEVLFEVSTDKVDSEVPSPVSGFVSEIVVAEGETVDVGAVIARVSDEEPSAADGGGDPSGGDAAAAAGDAGAGDDGVGEAEGSPEPAPAPPAQEAAPAPQAPETPPGATTPQTEAQQPDQSAPTDQSPSQAPPPSAAPSSGGSDGGRPDASTEGRLLSPVVRRLINEHDLDPDAIEGTGVGGRITRNDVLRAIDDQASAPSDRSGGSDAGSVDDGDASASAPAAAPAMPETQRQAESPQGPTTVGTTPQPDPAPEPRPAAEPAPESEPRLAPQARSEPPAPAPQPPARRAETAPATSSASDRSIVVPFNNIRRRTGEHMVMSKATSPHVLTVMEVDYENVDSTRRAHKEDFRRAEGYSLTYLPFQVRAVVEALGDFGDLNASVEGDHLVVHRDVNIGIAVDLDHEGLIVPVLRSADTKNLKGIAREINELAAKARGKRLAMDDISGGTFSISNNGSYGTYTTAAIINQPQVAVLSTDGIARRPVVVEDSFGNETLAVHSVGHLSLSWDHRAFDGSYAASFLRRCKEVLETRDWVQEL